MMDFDFSFDYDQDKTYVRMVNSSLEITFTPLDALVDIIRTGVLR